MTATQHPPAYPVLAQSTALYGVFLGSKFALTRSFVQAVTAAKSHPEGEVRTYPDGPGSPSSWDAPTFRVCSDPVDISAIDPRHLTSARDSNPARCRYELGCIIPDSGHKCLVSVFARNYRQAVRIARGLGYTVESATRVY